MSAHSAPTGDGQQRRPVPAPPKVLRPQPGEGAGGAAQPQTPARATRRRRRRRRRMPQGAIVFVGPMAAGKSSLGRQVAKELRVPFVDTDSVFVRANGPITEFFAQHGEAAFREREEEIIAAELAQPGLRIVALGGGAVLSARTRELLARRPVILLMTTQEAVLRTANIARRPLLRDDPNAWNRILEERRHLYEEVANITYRTDRASKAQLTRRVTEWVRGVSHKYEERP